jgi:phenylacetate-CoA ligase
MRFLQEKFQPDTSALHRIVSHAYENNPFYRRKLGAAPVAVSQVHRASDLKALPFTSREELQADPWLLLAVPKQDVIQTHISTGTTGRRPTYIHYDWRDLYQRGLVPLVAGASTSKMLRIDAGEVVYNALPYEVSVTGMAVHRAVQDGIGACVVPVGKGGYYADPHKAIKVMRAVGTGHLFTTPSYAVHLGEVAREAGDDVPAQIGLRSIWLIGELCSQALRRRIEALWGCAAFLYYGSMESGAIGIECSMHDGYHVATNFACVESIALDDPREDAPAGELGEIVVTPLWRYASPLVRYKTGDLGRWDPTPCRCGIEGPRLHVHGRVEDMVCVGARKLHVLDIENLLLDLPEVSTWFRIKAVGEELHVLLPKPAGAPSSDVRAVVRDHVARALGVPCVASFVPDPGYGGGKFLRVVREQTAKVPS